MRIFVCKYVTGGGIADMPLPRTLQHEGDMTLRALVRDLSAIGGVTLLVARDTRLLSPRLPGTPVPVASRDDCWQVWAEAISAADAVWPVAPETGGLLQRLSQLVIDSGKTLLGCRPKAVRLCGNKLETAAHLAGHGIAVVPTQPLTANVVRNLPDAVGGWVVKPNDGAGAADTYLVTNREALASFQAAAPVRQNWIVQPFRPGAAVSLCLLCRDRDASLLSCNCQHVALASGRFRYQGWTVGGADARRAEYEPIAKAIARTVPGLFGYVGVDLIDASEGPAVLEVNPRLTTSYAGLRDAIAINPAEHVLALAAGGALPIARATRPQRLRLDP